MLRRPVNLTWGLKSHQQQPPVLSTVPVNQAESLKPDPTACLLAPG